MRNGMNLCGSEFVNIWMYWMNIKYVFVILFCFRCFSEEIVMKIIICLNFFFFYGYNVYVMKYCVIIVLKWINICNVSELLVWVCFFFCLWN